LEMITAHFERASSNDGYSEFIYYCATDEEVREFRSRFSDSGMTAHAESSKASHEETHKTQTKILQDVKAVSEAVHAHHACCGGKTERDLKAEQDRQVEQDLRFKKMEQDLTKLTELVSRLLDLQNQQSATTTMK
ncbi:hypothetical protein BGX34_007247, partial [Mortierella sp. NVP85]